MQGWRDGLAAAAANSYNPTRVNTSQAGDGQSADVRVAVGDIDTGYNGYVYCPTDGTRSGTDPNESCFNQWLKIDTSNASGPFWDADRRKSLMCHEFGHTLGLRHIFDNSCMTRSIDNPNRASYLFGHSMDHLDDNY